MKYTQWIVVSLIGFFIITGSGQISAQTQQVGSKKKLYESYLSEKIANYHSKTNMKNSRSKNLQVDAETAEQKATFLTLNRNILVEEMIERDVDPKHYQIDFYLNKRFYESRK